jgi:hypothetical protein
MHDRNDIINQIQDALGAEGSRELAEQIYDELRADDRIYFNDSAGLDRQGLVIRDGVDLVAVAAQVLELNRVHNNWQRSTYTP